MAGRERVRSSHARPFYFRRNFWRRDSSPPLLPGHYAARAARHPPCREAQKDSEPAMNTRTKLYRHAPVLRLFLITALLLLLGAPGARAQSKPNEKRGGAAAEGAAATTPSEVVRAYYTALRDGRVRDAMMLSILRP